jgi:hypothetical protein
MSSDSVLLLFHHSVFIEICSTTYFNMTWEISIFCIWWLSWFESQLWLNKSDFEWKISHWSWIHLILRNFIDSYRRRGLCCTFSGQRTMTLAEILILKSCIWRSGYWMSHTYRVHIDRISAFDIMSVKMIC